MCIFGTLTRRCSSRTLAISASSSARSSSSGSVVDDVAVDDDVETLVNVDVDDIAAAAVDAS